MADHTIWTSTITALNEAGYDALTYDHIGHGSTGIQNREWVDRKWHFDDFTRHINLLVEAVRPGEMPIAVVGCSMGGVLALRYAMMYGTQRGEPGSKRPQKILKAVCIGAPGMKTLPESIPRWEERKTMFKEDGVDRLAHLTATRWCPDPAPQGLRERVEAMCKRTSSAGYQRCAEAIVNYDYESNGELEALADKDRGFDVLVIRGENDEAVGPKAILETVARRAGGRFVEMEGVGHVSPLHDPV